MTLKYFYFELKLRLQKEVPFGTTSESQSTKKYRF